MSNRNISGEETLNILLNSDEEAGEISTEEYDILQPGPSLAPGLPAIPIISMIVTCINLYYEKTFVPHVIIIALQIGKR